MTFNTLTIWLIAFKYIDFWYIDKLHIWLFDTLTKETYDLLQGSLKNIQAAVYNGARTVIKFQPSEGHPY